MKNQKGFTIIELVVVIAIIAVLAGIVLVNVTQYIAKSRDVAIKGNLSGMTTDAAIVFDNYTSYSGNATAANSLCDAAGKYFSTVNSAVNAFGGGVTCANNNARYCASAQMKVNVNNYFCVDYNGLRVEGTKVCNTTNFDCE